MISNLYSVVELQGQITEIRSLRQGFFTNFYLDPKKHGIWIEKGDCYSERVGNTLFIIKVSSVFWNVFYCSTTLEDFGNDQVLFRSMHPNTLMMYDIVGRDYQCQPIVDLLISKGCIPTTCLIRMSRKTEPIEYIPDSSVRCANKGDLFEISQLLHVHFDEKTEQIPYNEELADFIDNGHVLVCIIDGEMVGFLIYEMSSHSQYLRYWFTRPDFRNMKVGSRLMSRFFKEGDNTVRQLFWVKRSNEDAIKRYRHYGFVEENMFDFVLQSQ